MKTIVHSGGAYNECEPVTHDVENYELSSKNVRRNWNSY